LNKAKLILILGSFIAALSGFLAAFVPGIAYITISAEWANFLLPDAPHFLTYPPLIFSIHDLTVKLLVTAVGGLVGVFSILENKSTVPFLSFAGISLGTIGFLLPSGASQGLVDVFSANIPWIGSLTALVGVLIMFLGFALRNAKVPRRALVVVPILLIVYLISPVLILTDNLSIYIFMQANLSMSTIMGILMLGGHLVIIWAGITGLRIPEKEPPKPPVNL
jgi:hypothetical protein